MILLLRPRGRGNWAPVRMEIKGRRLESLLVRRGQTFELGGVLWRIAGVWL